MVVVCSFFPVLRCFDILDPIYCSPHSENETQKIIVLFTSSASTFDINLTPKDLVWVHVNDSLTLECKVNGCDAAVSFLWGSIKDQPLYGIQQTNGATSILKYDYVETNFANSIVCKATCNGKAKQQTTSLKVYGRLLTLFYSLITKLLTSHLNCPFFVKYGFLNNRFV